MASWALERTLRAQTLRYVPWCGPRARDGLLTGKENAVANGLGIRPAVVRVGRGDASGTTLSETPEV